MSFIGIVTNQKNEEFIKNELYNFFDINKIIFIKDKNVENIKNVKFETIVLDENINNIKYLKKILENSKYIILNADMKINLEYLSELKLVVITYGFNNKSTFSVSSISDNNIIICLQRIIKNVYNYKFEPQEFEVKIRKKVNVNTIILVKILKILYKK